MEKQKEANKKKPIKRANGTGTIIDFGERSHLRYGARVTIGRTGGKQVYKWIGRWKTRTEARTYLDLYCAGKYMPAPDITFAELYDEWKGTHFKHISKQTEENYKAAYKHLADLHNIKFANLRTAHYQTIIDSLEKSRSTKSKIKVLLTLLYKYALQNDISNKDYGTFVRLDKEEKKEKEIFNDLEIAALWKNTNEPYLDTILILIYTGMRIQEMLDLTKFNIDLKAETITGGLKTDSGKNRVIPIHPKIKTIIEKYYNAATDKLFTRKNGAVLTQNYYRRYIFKPIMEKLKITDKTPHSTRHTFASMLANAKADTNSIKNLIGHSDYAFTANEYTHTDINELRKAIKMI